ncbi:S-adenosyl-L-methionine-dependent methyltransferase [Xylariaceae sp. FL0016]|nr:S-adenosyl-L-methionine-dependent methyltransferase [Xylariaceae sp. FL0016]
MATFARSTFSASSYAAFRPTYPPSLFRAVLAYHRGGGGRLVDLGCGHGFIARQLVPNFEHVDALDPSAGMLRQAQQITADQSLSDKIAFRQGGAEDLSFLADASIDLAVAGQAAHWFDYGKVWPNLARVVKEGGTVAFWGYKDNVLLGAEQATAIMERFVYGFGEQVPGIEGMGQYWEQPGRNILRNLLRSVTAPETEWQDLKRLEHEPGATNDSDEVCWLRKDMKLGDVEAYTRTFSCYSAWKDAHPETKSRAEGGKGDVVDFMWDEMVSSVPQWRAMGEKWREAEVTSDWGTYILLARRRSGQGF